MSKNKSYFLCSEAVIKAFPKSIRSKGFKSGYSDENEKYYIIFENFDKMNKYYEPLDINDPIRDDFWTRECVNGAMEVRLKKRSVFRN